MFSTEPEGFLAPRGIDMMMRAELQTKYGPSFLVLDRNQA